MSSLSVDLHSDRIGEATIAASQARLSHQIDEMHSIGLEDHSVLSLDHSFTPGADFGGGGKVSLTLTSSQGKILYFAIVESTGKAEILEALSDIGQRPGVVGKRFILCVDNMPHSGDTEYLRQMMTVSGAIAVIQDIFHVFKTLSSPLNNTHPDYKSGEVLVHRLKHICPMPL